MKCPSEYTGALRNLLARRTAHDSQRTGFTLVETMAATVLLAFIGASVWVVLERCMNSAADTTQRMRAFEIARENMENLLVADSVNEMTEFGVSGKFPDIRWQTTVESFYVPVSSRMWVRAVCSAEYTDAAGETKTVELTHWLTNLTTVQMQQITERMQKQEQQLTKHIIETEGLASQYVGVDVETIRQWVTNGMPTTAGGAYLKPWLDTYLQTDGRPTAQDKQDTLSRYPELAAVDAQDKTAQGQKTGLESDVSTGTDSQPAGSDSQEQDTTSSGDIDQSLRGNTRQLPGSRR